MFAIRKSYQISASHCIIGHPKCGRMHGHNYKIEIEIGSQSLSDNDMLIDFSELKSIMGKTFGKYDHKHLGVIPVGWKANTEHVIELPFKLTTAENLAKHWGEEILPEIKPLKLFRIDVCESDQSMASWIPTLEEK